MGKWRYGVILDAGSSGTRVHIYKWQDPEEVLDHGTAKELTSLPGLTTKDSWTKKIHPGVSSFAEKPDRIGPDHLEPLFQRALSVVPEEYVEKTPIFLLATAGMRLLEPPQQEALLKEICAYTRANTKFLLPDCDLHIQLISGATEGLYGWIAANYLLGGFDSPADHAHGKDHHTYGFLDMGGASAQIAFAPNRTEAVKHANDLTLLRMRKSNGQSEEFKVFVTTWLEFGVNEARRRYVERLEKDTKLPAGVMHLEDPCLPKELHLTASGHLPDAKSEASGYGMMLVGTGDFKECLEHTYPLLDKDAPCLDEPCLLHGVHVPAIDFDVNHFVGISEYWHTTHEIFEMAHKDKAYDFATYQGRVKDFCEKDWSDITKGIDDHKWGKKVGLQIASEVCFKASWLINVLHNGIGIPRVGLEGTAGSDTNGTKEAIHHSKEKGFLDPFQAVNKIQNTEVSWTLGKMVLYAASQVPPQDAKALPVGFGSNEPGIPPDFQYPSSKHYFEDHDDDSFASDIHDTLFSGDSPRRIPGVLLFVLIVIIATYFLCGRDRRSKFYRKFTSSPSTSSGSSRKRRFLNGKIPFFSRTPSVAYERVLEEGPDDIPAPGDFELGPLDDSSGSDSEPSKKGRASGWATLKFFDQDRSGGNRPGSRNGSAGNAMDRNGLAVRTESRERLPTLASGGGGRSRNQSPIRGKRAM